MAVEDALIAAGLLKIDKDFRGERWLRLPSGSSCWFDRYNVAERITNQQDAERREAEYRAQRDREFAAISAAYAEKRTTPQVEPLPPPPDPKHEQTAYGVSEKLRQRAEMDVASEKERSRRPSWAPPLIIEDELLEVCRELGYLTPDDKPIVRLWAQFADPKRVGTHLRETVSDLPLHGIACRGFQLHPGGERQNTSNILFEAQRERSGNWRFGPRWSGTFSYTSAKRYEWEQAIRERLRAQEKLDAAQLSPADLNHLEQTIERCSRLIAEINTKDQTAAAAYNRKQSLRRRAVELAKTRVLAFAGAPDTEMQMAGRLWGHCCVCGKALTDPISRERGIGPECLENEIWSVRYWANKLGENADVLRVAERTELPIEFVAAVLNLNVPEGVT